MCPPFIVFFFFCSKFICSPPHVYKLHVFTCARRYYVTSARTIRVLYNNNKFKNKKRKYPPDERFARYRRHVVKRLRRAKIKTNTCGECAKRPRENEQTREIDVCNRFELSRGQS